MSNKKKSLSNLWEQLVEQNYLFRELKLDWLIERVGEEKLTAEKLYSNRPLYTAFESDRSLDYLYAIMNGGPIITRSTPLDRIIDITYPGTCLGMRNLALGFGSVCRAFPSLVEAYKTADTIQIPVNAIAILYESSELFRQRYNFLFELQEKFQYHLLNCSTYPPQAVAALLRALIYQERELGNQPSPDGSFTFDLPVDAIARACQLNHRTVEQTIKGMTKVGLLKSSKSDVGDLIYVIDPEGLKEVYGATRDKVAWWPLR